MYPIDRSGADPSSSSPSAVSVAPARKAADIVSRWEIVNKATTPGRFRSAPCSGILHPISRHRTLPRSASRLSGWRRQCRNVWLSEASTLEDRDPSLKFCPTHTISLPAFDGDGGIAG